MAWTIISADARQIPLKDQSVQCVVTSPPYWGLRDYGVAGQIGLEKTPEEYVEKMVAVFREVRRVLKDDGTCWLNLGDSYAGSWGNYSPKSPAPLEGWSQSRFDRRAYDDRTWRPANSYKQKGLKTKDLVGIPWRVAFALQADGWYLRSDIIWSKPNPMPESVTDRPTKAHEYIFLLSKNERYFFDQDAVKEPATGWNGSRFDDPRDLQVRPTTGRAPRQQTNGKHSTTAPQAPGRRIVESVKTARANGANHDNPFGETRNIRTVWEIATQPFPEAHFATFPQELAERCIKAGSKPGDIVLDPFSGAGTTPLVADKLNRFGIGLELKPDYCRMAHRRCFDDAPLLVGV